MTINSDTQEQPDIPLAALQRIFAELEQLDQRDLLITLAYLVDRFVGKHAAMPIRRKL